MSNLSEPELHYATSDQAVVMGVPSSSESTASTSEEFGVDVYIRRRRTPSPLLKSLTVGDLMAGTGEDDREQLPQPYFGTKKNNSSLMPTVDEFGVSDLTIDSELLMSRSTLCSFDDDDNIDDKHSNKRSPKFQRMSTILSLPQMFQPRNSDTSSPSSPSKLDNSLHPPRKPGRRESKILAISSSLFPPRKPGRRDSASISSSTTTSLIAASLQATMRSVGNSLHGPPRKPGRRESNDDSVKSFATLASSCHESWMEQPEEESEAPEEESEAPEEESEAPQEEPEVAIKRVNSADCIPRAPRRSFSDLSTISKAA